MKSKKLLALLLSAGMTLSMIAGCQNNANVALTPGQEQEQGQEGEVTDPVQTAEGDTTIVYATSTFGQKFSPFFVTTAYDQEVVDLTQSFLLAADRGGAVIGNGIDGETVTYNGSDYEYRGMGNVEVVQNADGSVDYNLTMREGVKFSDGVDATIDDVIFTIYVLCDPTYDGSSTIYALPIEGMDEYRGGMDTKFNLIVSAGKDNDDFTFWTEDEQTALWEDLEQAGAAFCQEIVDYCVDAEYAADSNDVATAAEAWGFPGLTEESTTTDMFYLIADAYGWDLASMSDTESAGSSLFDLMNGKAVISGTDDT